MNRRKIKKALLVLSLCLFTLSGVYGIVTGIRSTNEYYHLTEELRSREGISIPLGSLLLNYLLGCLRGVVTCVCGGMGLAALFRGGVKNWNYALTGVLTMFYLLGLVEYPYFSQFVQALAAVFCFGMLTICKKSL